MRYTSRMSARRKSIVSRARIGANTERVKRPYTMSEAALAQRRAAQPAAVQAGTLAGKSTGPRTEEGKAITSRNAWKHGRYSAVNRQRFGLGATSMAKLFAKPCLTSCPFHPDNAERTDAPCSLVLDGLTRAGGSCLDKTVYVHALDALMAAMADGDMDGMHGALATEMASNLNVLDAIRQGIADHGVMTPVYAVSKSGDLIRDAAGNPMVMEVKVNPLIPQLTHLTDKLGISLDALMVSPRARERLAEKDEGEGAMQAALGAIFGRALKALPGAGGGGGAGGA